MVASSDPDREWTEEMFWFGNACYPSDATYRRSGETLQGRAEKSIDLRLQGNSSSSFEADADVLQEFLTTYQDCKLHVHAGYTTENDRKVPPTIWMIGWYDVTTEAEIRQYELDKRDGS